MRKVLVAIPFLVLFLAAPAMADDVWIGRLTSSGSSVNQETTAVPFTIPGVAGGTRIMVQCDGTAYIATGTGAGFTTTSTAAAGHGERCLADNFVDVHFQGGRDHLAMISASGTVNCDVFEVYP